MGNFCSCDCTGEEVFKKPVELPLEKNNDLKSILGTCTLKNESVKEARQMLESDDLEAIRTTSTLRAYRREKLEQISNNDLN